MHKISSDREYTASKQPAWRGRFLAAIDQATPWRKGKQANRSPFLQRFGSRRFAGCLGAAFDPPRIGMHRFRSRLHRAVPDQSPRCLNYRDSVDSGMSLKTLS
jgi:hypothetical protein